MLICATMIPFRSLLGVGFAFIKSVSTGCGFGFHQVKFFYYAFKIFCFEIKQFYNFLMYGPFVNFLFFINAFPANITCSSVAILQSYSKFSFFPLDIAKYSVLVLHAIVVVWVLLWFVVLLFVGGSCSLRLQLVSFFSCLS
jgi:hypothetical protein